MCDGGQTNEGNGQTAEARKIPPCRVMDKYINAQIHKYKALLLSAIVLIGMKYELLQTMKFTI